MMYLSPALKKYLREIKAWRFLTQSHFSLFFNCTKSTAKKCLDLLLEENLIVQLGAVTGAKGEWLRGKWLTTRKRAVRLRTRRGRGCVATSKGFQVPAHQLIVPHTVKWILGEFPDVKFISEPTLRYEYGWYWKRPPKYLPDTVFPHINYVPDALGVYNKEHFRLEVQLNNVRRDFFEQMIGACQDTYPILLICYPGRKEYFLNLSLPYQHKVTVVELHDDAGLKRFFNP